MDSTPNRRRIQCFYPILGIVLGFALGWALHFAVPKPPKEAEFVDIATRLFMVIFGIIGWAAGIVRDKRKLHCGGTKELDAVTKKRYFTLSLFGLAFLILATVFLATTRLVFYFVTILLILLVLVGEIGWGSPWEPFKIPLGRGKK
jgi:peptidoglycan/LPS O-acetylase OafA/YrhL